MSRTALAFMSYVNEDDRHDNGWMTQFRERLSGEVRMHTGEPFDIFQDRKDIAWGQQWQERINQSLDAVTFLIPILTPAFFKSTACRDELERFLKREERLGRSDLILPVYYVNCPVLQDEAKREHDNLAKVVAKRQYADWRDLRFEDFTSPQLRKALAKMAQQIMEALERSEAESARAEAMRKTDAAKAAAQPESSKKEAKETASSANTFQSGGGEQSIAQGSNAIGTQINNYYAPPQPAPAAKSEPPTVVVDTWHLGDYATITEALAIVKPGTRILVRPGLYQEGIVIDKHVEIIGDGERDKIVIEASDRNAILFKTDNGRVANLTLRQLISNEEKSCVRILQGRLKLEYCDISSRNDTCVTIESGANPRLCHCRIHDAYEYGVMVCGNGQGSLEDNEIFANMVGVLISGFGNITVRRNHITENSWVGIEVYANGGGIFEDNDLRGNRYGAWDITPDCEANVQRRGNKE